MTASFDADREARLLIMRHGKDAGVAARAEADKCAASGDHFRAAQWDRVCRTIKAKLNGGKPAPKKPKKKGG